MEKISVFLADWQVLFREGIHFTLCGEEDMEVIGEATSGEEALSFIEANPPRIAILSINGGKLGGIRATHRIKRSFPSVSVILITDIDDEEHLFAAMKCGASAYFTKDIDPVELVNLIRNVAQGAQPLSKALLTPEIASRAIEEFEAYAAIGEEAENLFAVLSSVEADILYRIAKGNSSEQIAQALGITKEEVNHNLGLILSKLVANEHNREVIEVAQKGLPTMIPRAGKPSAEYVTQDEFNAFKEALGERLKSVIDELISARREETKPKPRPKTRTPLPGVETSQD